MKEPEYDHIKARLALISPGNVNEPVRHETISCVIATRILRDCLGEFSKYGIDIEDVVSDVCAIIDNDIKPSARINVFPYGIERLFHDISLRGY
jgi:hypothetical protein